MKRKVFVDMTLIVMACVTGGLLGIVYGPRLAKHTDPVAAFGDANDFAICWDSNEPEVIDSKELYIVDDSGCSAYDVAFFTSTGEGLRLRCQGDKLDISGNMTEGAKAFFEDIIKPMADAYIKAKLETATIYWDENTPTDYWWSEIDDSNVFYIDHVGGCKKKAMVPNARFTDNLQYWQIEALRAFDSGAVDFMILEWARRHWKSTTILNILLRECAENPNSIYTHVFPFYREARETIWDDPNMLDSYLPDKGEIGWTKNESKLHVKYDNNSIYRLVGADNFDSLRGPGCHGVGLDEWSMIKPEAWTQIFMPILAGKQHGPEKRRRRFALFGYTPKGINHATRMFDWAAFIKELGQTLPTNGRAAKCRDRWFASRVINDETNFLDAEFLKMAEELWPVAVRDQEINCARVTDEERVLITSRMIDDLKGYHIHPTKTRQIVSCDPSLGGDACPIQYIKNGRIEDKVVLHERNPMIITGHIIAMMTKHQCEDAIVDATGITIGKAIVARMAEQGHTRVYGFESAGEATDKKRFVNRKTEAWMEVCEQVQAHEIPYIEDDKTREDVSSVRYKISDSRGRLGLEPKDDTKKRLGRSPDDGDTYVMGQWRLPYLEPLQDREKRKRDKWDRKKKRTSAMSG